MTTTQAHPTALPSPAGPSVAAVSGRKPSMAYRDPGRGYVQVPVAQLKEKAETVLIISMLARRLRASSGGVVEGVLQAHLAHELRWVERDCDVSATVANRVSKWIRDASQTSWLDVQHSHDARRQRTMARYKLWGRPSVDNAVEYVVAPAVLFDMVRDGVIDKHGFLGWLRWRAGMGTGTSTGMSVPEFAREWDVSEATARRHRSALLKAGALTEVASSGGASITALPEALLPEKRGKATPIKNHEPPQSETMNHPSQEPGPYVPVGVPKGVSISSSAVADVPAVTREADPAASPKQNLDQRPERPARLRASADALAAAGRLLTRFRPELVSCDPHFRRGIIRRTALFLDAGYGDEALVRAANVLTIDIVEGNHNQVFRTALASLASDVHGGACRGCGLYADEDGHHLKCGASTAAQAGWLEQVTTLASCVTCGASDATRREDLPIPVAVCDPCWMGSEDVDPASVEESLERSVNSRPGDAEAGAEPVGPAGASPSSALGAEVDRDARPTPTYLVTGLGSLPPDDAEPPSAAAHGELGDRISELRPVRPMPIRGDRWTVLRRDDHGRSPPRRASG